MRQLFKYSLLQAVRTKDAMFWGLCFPIILSLLFFFSFMGGGKETELANPVKVAVALDKSNTEVTAFREFLEQMDGDLIEVSYMSEADGKKALKEGEIKGLYTAAEKRKLYVSDVGMEQTILGSLLESYNQNEALILDVVANHPEKLNGVIKSLDSYQNMTKDQSLGGKVLDGDIQFFFALIGMACMYGCFGGLTKAIEMQANITALGARKSITPTHRLKVICADMGAAVCIHFANMAVLLLFIKYVLKLEFNGSFGGMTLICLFGTLIGVALGIAVGSVGKWGEGIKVGILLGVSMIFSFLAGLMMAQMKDLVEQHLPILNRINPVAVISDAFYCLTVYNDPVRYTRDLIILGAMSTGLILISFLMVRRERYDSI